MTTIFDAIEKMEISDGQINRMAKLVMSNGVDCYTVLYNNGESEVGNAICYSNILQCGDPIEKYDMVAMFECNPDLSYEQAELYVKHELGLISDKEFDEESWRLNDDCEEF